MDLTTTCEELRLKLFWLVNGHETLARAMAAFNYRVAQCGCVMCRTEDRCEADDDFEEPEDVRCRFKVAFEAELARRGFIVSFHRHGMDADGRYEDSHFINPCQIYWMLWRFGRTLLEAKTVTDPELQRYVALLDFLDPERPKEMSYLRKARNFRYVDSVCPWPYAK